MGGQKPETNKNKISVGLLAHVDAGKTTLSEALLYLTGAIRKMGRVDDRDAFLDTYELERERGITIFSKQAVFEKRDKETKLDNHNNETEKTDSQKSNLDNSKIEKFRLPEDEN